MTDRNLTDADVAALAAELRDLAGDDSFVDADALEKRTCLSRDFFWDRKAEFGAINVGSKSRPRWIFYWPTVRARLLAMGDTKLESDRPAATERATRGRPRAAGSTSRVPLIEYDEPQAA